MALKQIVPGTGVKIYIFHLNLMKIHMYGLSIKHQSTSSTDKKANFTDIQDGQSPRRLRLGSHESGKFQLSNWAAEKLQ